MANTVSLIDALAKLRWSADGEWSVPLKPEECRAILAVLPEESIVIKSLGAKDQPEAQHLPEFGGAARILTGDPGDEQPE